jgi:hypothetical protein
MTRLFVTLSLLLLLVGAAVWEQNFISSSYKTLQTDLDALVATMTAQVDTAIAGGGEGKDAVIDTPENIAHIRAMHTYWTKREKSLAMVARHFDLAQISDALIYLKNFVEFGNAEEAFAGAQRLQYLIEAHLFNLGASIQNVI